MLKASFESNLSLDFFNFNLDFFPNLMIYISKELYLYISYVIKTKGKNKLKTATGKLYVQNVQMRGNYYRRSG